jgi:hypothetical protein
MPTAWQLAAYLALPNSVAMHRPLLVRRAPGGRCAAGFSALLASFGFRGTDAGPAGEALRGRNVGAVVGAVAQFRN